MRSPFEAVSGRQGLSVPPEEKMKDACERAKTDPSGCQKPQEGERRLEECCNHEKTVNPSEVGFKTKRVVGGGFARSRAWGPGKVACPLFSLFLQNSVAPSFRVVVESGKG